MTFLKRPRPRIVEFLVVVALALLAATYLGTPGPPTGPPPAPPYAHSWYMTNVNDPTDLNSMTIRGIEDGLFDDSRCTYATVFLDFGEPVKLTGVQSYGGYGTKDFASDLVSDTQIVNAVQSYASGWYAATWTCPRLRIVVGTNNTADFASSSNGQGTEAGDPAAAGAWWAQVGYDAEQRIIADRHGGQIEVFTGSDMEPEWECKQRTEAFVNGYAYNVAAAGFLFDYGAAWPNPCTGSTGTSWGTVDDHCTDIDLAYSCHIAYVAYTHPGGHDYPFPEIYSHDATTSWKTVRDTYHMFFFGTMTECYEADTLPADHCTGSTQFAPNKAWSDLWITLDASPGEHQDTFPFGTSNIWMQIQ